MADITSDEMGQPHVYIEVGGLDRILFLYRVANGLGKMFSVLCSHRGFIFVYIFCSEFYSVDWATWDVAALVCKPMKSLYLCGFPSWHTPARKSMFSSDSHRCLERF